MNNLKNLTDLEKRKWLINEMQTKWRCNDVYGEADYENDSLIVCGNADIEFGTILKLCQQLDWIGFEFGDMEIYIDITIDRQIFRDANGYFAKECHLPRPDEFSITNGVIRMWYD